MTEAINALTLYAFKQMQVKRIAITCDPDNERSKKIPERLGYNLEGILKSNRFTTEGNVTDTLVFARYNAENLPKQEVYW
jgi:RimJ/RimL family protein N-acetyltransferase